MALDYQHELGLLRAILRGMRMAPRPEKIDHDYLRSEDAVLAHPLGDVVLLLNGGASDAFDTFCDELGSKTPHLERGATFADLRTVMLSFIVPLSGLDVGLARIDNVASIHHQLEQWFANISASRLVFVPCSITPWESPRFAIGPVQFLYVEHVAGSEVYPPPFKDSISRLEFDRLLDTMRLSRAHWLASASVERCDQKRGEEVGGLVVDLAITGLQLVLPLFWHTRNMSRLDARRGEAQTQSISLSNGVYAMSSTTLDAGLVIGQGTLTHALQRSASIMAAVGHRVMAFATGRFRFPRLEQAWCDAAYWLHEALSEKRDAVAIAKLETALEVLTCAENTKGSESRLEQILAAFYSLKPDDPLTPESETTAKEFAKRIVRDRSRILHGTWSTLNPRIGMDRAGLERFVLEVVRRAAVELDEYSHLRDAKDEITEFLYWVEQKTRLTQP